MSKYVVFNGIARWPKLKEGQEDLGWKEAGKEFGGWYVIDVEVTEDVIDVLSEDNVIQAEYAKETDNDEYPWRIRVKRKKPQGVPKLFEGDQSIADELTDGDSVVYLTSKGVKKEAEEFSVTENVFSGDKVRVYAKVVETNQKTRKGPKVSLVLVGVCVLERGEFAQSATYDDEIPF